MRAVSRIIHWHGALYSCCLMSLGEYLNQSLSDGVGISESGRVKVLTDVRVLMSEIQVTGYSVLSLSLGNPEKAEPFSDPHVGFFKMFPLHYLPANLAFSAS